MGQSALRSFDFEKFCGVVEVVCSGGNSAHYSDESLQEFGVRWQANRRKPSEDQTEVPPPMAQRTGSFVVAIDIELAAP